MKDFILLKYLKTLEYLTPLREGGSLPAVVYADDGETYVMKFHGSGQGKKALIAEIIGGELARYLGFNVPELVILHLDPQIAKSEPDPEIQDLLRASEGLNLGMKFISQAAAFSMQLNPKPPVQTASRIVWLDAFLTNVDRTAKNVNMIIQDEKLWLIDHGASLYFHHNWQDHIKQSETPFSHIQNHVMLELATEIKTADGWANQILDAEVFNKIVKMIPDDWLEKNGSFETAESLRVAYVEYLTHRLNVSHIFTREAENALAKRV